MRNICLNNVDYAVPLILLWLANEIIITSVFCRGGKSAIRSAKRNSRFRSAKRKQLAAQNVTYALILYFETLRKLLRGLKSLTFVAL